MSVDRHTSTGLCLCLWWNIAGLCNMSCGKLAFISIGKAWCLFAYTYRPPHKVPLRMIHLLKCFKILSLEKKLLFCVILTSLAYNGHQEKMSAGHVPHLESMFLDIFMSLGLYQWVLEPTFPRSGHNIGPHLDNWKNNIENASVSNFTTAGCDHYPVPFVFSREMAKYHHHGGENFSWHKANYSIGQMSYLPWLTGILKWHN